MSLLEEMLPRLKPYVLGWINDVQLSSIGAHDLGGKLHAGTLLDSQAPQFLKTDGSRLLFGNLSVMDGITIDGVDISVLGSDFLTHIGNASAHHDPVTVIDTSSIDITLSTQQISAAVIPGGVNHNSLLNYVANQHIDHSTISISAGVGLTGGGTIAATRTLTVDQSFSPVWTGTHQFNLDLLTSTILPRTTDTYDLGSSIKLWRKGYLSELDAVVFAQNTITLLGGWLLISKNEGSIVGDILAATTNIDFGSAMAVNDFVVMRAAGKVEYMQVTALVSGTTYTVTRNLDGSGANDWSSGTPWANLGYTGSGRIELNAYDTPRISIIEQGATYNAQTERIRMGDLVSWQSAGYTGYGMAMGNYSGNEYLVYSPTTGLIVRGTIRADDGFLGTLSVDGKLSISGASGALAIGTTPPTSATVGTGLWLDRTGLYSLASNVQQTKINAVDGKFYAGNNRVIIGRTGILLIPILSDIGPPPADDPCVISWTGASGLISELYSASNTTIGANSFVSESRGTYFAYNKVHATNTVGNTSGYLAALELNVTTTDASASLFIHQEAAAPLPHPVEVYLRTTSTSRGIDLDINTLSVLSVTYDGTSIYRAELGVAGTLSNPALTWGSDLDTGFFNQAADSLSITAGGVEMLRLTESTNDQVFIGPAGSATIPSLSWINDPNTGLSNAADTLYAITGGGTRIILNTTLLQSRVPYEMFGNYASTTTWLMKIGGITELSTSYAGVLLGGAGFTGRYKAGMVFAPDATGYGRGKLIFLNNGDADSNDATLASHAMMAIQWNNSVGIGTIAPNSSAILDLTSTTQAFLPPRMTTAQRDAIPSPVAGMVIYNTTTNVLNFRNATAWAAV